MIIDNIKNSKLYFSVNNNFKKAFEFIEKAVNDNFEVGKYEIDGDKVYALVQEYETKTHNDTKFEGHKKYIDIQYIIEGTEYIEIADIDGMEPFTVYDDDKDFTLYSDGKEIVQKCVLADGDFGIFYPHDLHKPGLLFKNSGNVKKIVVKIEI